MMKQEELNKKFPGEWLLLFNDKIIDHNINLEEILNIYDEKINIDNVPEDEIKISKVLTQDTRLHWSHDK